jgi:hypothetical protein
LARIAGSVIVREIGVADEADVPKGVSHETAKLTMNDCPVGSAELSDAALMTG